VDEKTLATCEVAYEIDSATVQPSIPFQYLSGCVFRGLAVD
jgi:hypothetical protein